MIDDILVKRVFFYVDDKDPHAFYADNVNILDFAKKLDAVTSLQHRAAEKARCVEFIRQHDPKLADLLSTASSV